MKKLGIFFCAFISFHYIHAQSVGIPGINPEPENPDACGHQ